jgi:hypothetical protein
MEKKRKNNVTSRVSRGESEQASKEEFCVLKARSSPRDIVWSHGFIIIAATAAPEQPQQQQQQRFTTGFLDREIFSLRAIVSFDFVFKKKRKIIIKLKYEYTKSPHTHTHTRESQYPLDPLFYHIAQF